MTDPAAMQLNSVASGYCQGVWDRRYFWLSLVMLDLRNRYKRSALGIGWSLLQPLAMTAVLCFAFHTIFNVNIREFGPFVLVGMAVWNFISAVVGDGCMCLLSADGYIRSSRVPLAIFPLRTVLGATVHFLLTLAVAFAVTVLFTGVCSPLALASLLPSLLILFLFGWTVASILGFANVYFADTQHSAAVFLQMLFYLSPVLYPPSLMEGRGIGKLMEVNPLAKLILLFREPIVHGTIPPIETYAFAVGTVMVLLAITVFVIARHERKIIFYM